MVIRIQNSFLLKQKTVTRNQIFSILDEEDIEHKRDSKIAGVAQEFYTDLYKSELSRQNNNHHVFNGFQPHVSEEINLDLIKGVTEDEIKEVIFSIEATKAPGPDGFTGAFYQAFWSDIKDNIIEEVRGFFEQDNFDKEVNHTNIFLIPKIANPRKMTDFRPIALCNVSYKIISKILVTRLKKHLSNIISEEQAAFIPGRVITDNVIIAHEVMHALKVRRRCANAYMAIKTDITKASDRLEWDFLQETLHKLGFMPRFIE